MKKTIFISALAVLVMVACKKDRTCTCTATPVSSTANGVSQTLGQPTKTVTKLTKVSKGAADCNSSEETIKATVAFAGTVIAVVSTVKNDCTLD